MTDPYIYQTVHTLNGHARRLTAHLTVLDTASRALFMRPLQIDADILKQQITERLSTATHTDRSIFVRIICTASGSVRTELAGISLYRGYDLRSLTPKARTISYDIPFGDHPSSLRESLTAWALVQVQEQSAVRCTGTGMAVTGDDAPLFAVKGSTVFTSPALWSVEAEIAAECIAAAGLELIIKPLMRTELNRFDELFYFDHRGVTAFTRCDGHVYMSLMATRIAHQAARLTR